MERRKAIILILAIIILGMVLYRGNIRPFLASRALAKGNFVKSLFYNTFVSYEAVKAMAEKAVRSENPEFIVFTKEQLEKEIKKRPNDAKLYIHLAYVSYRLGRKERSVWAVKKALSLAPNRSDFKELLLEVEKPFFEK